MYLLIPQSLKFFPEDYKQLSNLFRCETLTQQKLYSSIVAYNVINLIEKKIDTVTGTVTYSFIIFQFNISQNLNFEFTKNTNLPEIDFKVNSFLEKVPKRSLNFLE